MDNNDRTKLYLIFYLTIDNNDRRKLYLIFYLTMDNNYRTKLYFNYLQGILLYRLGSQD